MNWKHYAKEMMEGAMIFREQGGSDSIMPTWFLANKNDRTYILGTPWRNDLQKRLAAEYIAEKVIEFKATRVIFLADVWTRHSPGDGIEEDTYARVAYQLDAVEAIMCQCWTKNQNGFTLIQLYREKDDFSIEKLEFVETNGEGETDIFDIVRIALQNV
jgi:hypothetical protein